MKCESISVNLTGPAFSLLLYENARNEYDQEGFLLGEIITNEKRTITDNDQDVINIEHLVKINSVLPCPQMGYFYDNNGRVNKKKLKSYLGTKFSNVVCWYKFKHTPSFKLTAREKLIFKQLMEIFLPKIPEHFLCCLLTTESDTGATHLFSQTFMRRNNVNFQPVPMHITNLKDPYDVYKHPEGCSDTFKNIMKSLKIETKTSQGYTIISKIEKGLDNHISKVVEELCEAEKKMYDLECEVKRLRENIKLVDDSNEELEDTFELFDDNGCLSSTLNTSADDSGNDVSGSDKDTSGTPKNRRTTRNVAVQKQSPENKETIEKRTRTVKNYAQALQKT